MYLNVAIQKEYFNKWKLLYSEFYVALKCEHTVKFQIEDALLLNFSNFGARFYSKISKFYVVKFL